MRTKSCVALCSAALFLGWTFHNDAALASRAQRTADAHEDLLGPDIEQHTCALEVVLAVHGMPAPRVADSAPLKGPVPMDVPPSGALACLPPPAE